MPDPILSVTDLKKYFPVRTGILFQLRYRIPAATQQRGKKRRIESNRLVV